MRWRPTIHILWRAPSRWTLRFIELDPSKTLWSLAYKWILVLGPLELRKRNR